VITQVAEILVQGSNVPGFIFDKNLQRVPAPARPPEARRLSHVHMVQPTKRTPSSLPAVLRRLNERSALHEDPIFHEIHLGHPPGDAQALRAFSLNGGSPRFYDFGNP